jgi:hypothetical protein
MKRFVIFVPWLVKNEDFLTAKLTVDSGCDKIIVEYSWVVSQPLGKRQPENGRKGISK